MYPTPLNRLAATLMLSILCLQGCRSSFQVSSEDIMLKKLVKTSADGQAISQVVVPDVPSSDVSNSRLSTAASAPPPSMATSLVQMTFPTGYLAVEPAAVPSCEQIPSTESEETNKKPAAPIVRISSSECLSSLRALSLQSSAVFGAQAWCRYFGAAGEAPSLPSDIDEILDSLCPFWPGQAVKDTHLLVLIPSMVAGAAFTLNLLEELAKNPRGGGHSTQYFLYDDEVQCSLGEEYPSSSYWILLTRDVLPGSIGKTYAAHQALVAAQTAPVHDSPYEIPVCTGSSHGYFVTLRA